jgi:hydroxypyruvate isomerase
VQNQPFSLAASAEMLYLELDFVDRVNRIDELGFLVEIWSWKNKDLAKLAATGANFQSMTGYLEGDLIDQSGIDRLIATALESIEASKVINCQNLNLHGTGLDANGQAIKKKLEVSERDWSTAQDTLARIAELGAKHNRVFTLENLNTKVDHPGTPFASSKDTLRLVSGVNSPGLRMNLDLYHAQIDEGNLTEISQLCLPWVGEIKVADVPGRMEPGTGEINYPFLARKLFEFGYNGVIGLEGWASADSDSALEAFRGAFTL